jgi:hypothetical protein
LSRSSQRPPALEPSRKGRYGIGTGWSGRVASVRPRLHRGRARLGAGGGGRVARWTGRTAVGVAPATLQESVRAELAAHAFHLAVASPSGGTLSFSVLQTKASSVATFQNGSSVSYVTDTRQCTWEPGVKNALDVSFASATCVPASVSDYNPYVYPMNFLENARAGGQSRVGGQPVTSVTGHLVVSTESANVDYGTVTLWIANGRACYPLRSTRRSSAGSSRGLTGTAPR